MSFVKTQGKIVDRSMKENQSKQFNQQIGNSQSLSGSMPAPGGQEQSVKTQLFEQMKKSGVLDSLKSQLRGRLYDQLKLKNEKVDVNLNSVNNRLTFKIAVSLIADLMKKCDMPYAMSVFLPECGVSQEILTKSELVDVLSLQHDELIKSMGDTTPLLLDLVDQIKSNGSVRPNMTSACSQTEDVGSEGLSLDQKLRNIDYGLMERVQVERAMPFKSLEERMMKYKREADKKYADDLQREISRLRDFEVSKIRMDEAQKYRSKLTQFTEEMESLHLEKVKELKLREQETVSRIQNKEREVEKVAFQHRQTVLKDEEMLRYKEAECKKTMEMELLLVKQERDKTKSLQHEYDQKLAEMSNIKLKMEKDMAEELQKFKSNYQRQFQDKDFDIHRRILNVEEDENRVKLTQERLQETEKRNHQIMNEVGELRTEIDELRKDNSKFQRENLDSKDQIRVLNENLKREAEISRSRESEARVHGQENRTLKKLLEDSKEDYGAHKIDQNRLIDNLRLQLDETKDMIDRIRETKDRELRRMRDKFDDERRKETEKYQFEYDKLREEIQLFARKLGQEENLNKQLSMLNYKLQNNLSDLGRDFGNGEENGAGGVKSSTFYPGALDIDNDTGEEIFARKRAWADLEREQDEVKSNIKSLMRKAPESVEIDNPMLAERIGNNHSKQPANYRVPQDVILEKKHQKQLEDIKRDQPSSSSDYAAKSKKKEKAETKSGRNKFSEPSAPLDRDSSQEYLHRTKDKLTKDRSNEDLSMSSQSKAQQTQKRQWKAPATTNFNDDYNDPNVTEVNQKTGNFNSLTNEVQKPAEPKIEAKPESVEEKKPSNDSGGKKSLFGSKKNVFNPFAKKTGPKPVSSGGPASAVGSSFAKESNAASENKYGQKSGGFTDNSFTAGAADRSKLSSGGPLSGGFDSKPETKEPAFLDNFANQKKKSSGSGDGIDEEIIDSDYNDDEFDVGSNMKSEKEASEKNFFNQNKNFTGHLGGFSDKEKANDLKIKSDKPSENESGLGFTDNYDEDFF